MRIQKAPVRVVVAIITRANGEFLIAERPESKAHAGLWEFPGGKVEGDENDREALLRELDEELGIRVDHEAFAAFAEIASGHLTLAFYRIHAQQPLSPQGREGQRWRWVAREALAHYPFPEPNRVVLAALLQGKEGLQ